MAGDQLCRLLRHSEVNSPAPWAASNLLRGPCIAGVPNSLLEALAQYLA